MKTEKLNFIFSILFFIGSISFTGFFWQKFVGEKYWPDFFSEARKHSTQIYVFYGVIIAATFFNILAYKFSCCMFYLMGVFGFALFTLSHIGNILVQIHAIFYKSNYLDDEFVIGANFGLPLGLFGLVSTLHCFQKTYNEKMKDENKYVNLGMKDFTKCVTAFNAAIIFIFIFYFCCLSSKYGEVRPEYYLFFVPPIFPLIIILAIFFKNRKLCIVALVGYGIFVALSILCFGSFVYDIFGRYYNWNIFNELFMFTTIVLATLTYIFVGVFTTLHLYQKYGNQNTEIKAPEQSSKNVFSKTSFYLCQSAKGFMA